MITWSLLPFAVNASLNLSIFLPLAPAACFPALGISSAHVFPRLAPVCMFSRAWYRLHEFTTSSDWTCFSLL